MLTKEPDLQKWADSILATEPSERAEMVAEDPSVFEVVRKALDAERQTVAKLREALIYISEHVADFTDYIDEEFFEMTRQMIREIP